jgi:hypothetical protein
MGHSHSGRCGEPQESASHLSRSDLVMAYGAPFGSLLTYSVKREILHLVERFQRLFRAGDFLEDFGGGLFPDIGFWTRIVIFQVVHDGLLQFCDALKCSAADALSADLA